MQAQFNKQEVKWVKKTIIASTARFPRRFSYSFYTGRSFGSGFFCFCVYIN